MNKSKPPQLPHKYEDWLKNQDDKNNPGELKKATLNKSKQQPTCKCKTCKCKKQK